MDLRVLQQEVEEWGQKNFPNAKEHHSLLGAQEEIGELSHAHLKQEQGIRGTWQEHQEAKVDAVADCIIFLSHYCSLNGIDLDDAVIMTWRKVKERNWQLNPKTGVWPILQPPP